MSQQDDEKLDSKLPSLGALPLPPMPPLSAMPSMDSPLPLPPMPSMDSPLPLPPMPSMDSPLPLPPMPSMDLPLPLPPAPVMAAPLPLPPVPVMDAPLPLPLPLPPAPLPVVAPVVAEPALPQTDPSYGDLWAKRSDKPLPQIYGHIDRIANSEAGSLLDRYADRFGHSIDRDIIVLRKQQIDNKISEIRDAPTVELIGAETMGLELDEDMDLSEQLLAIESELRSLKPEYQAAKSSGDSKLLAQLRPQLESLMVQRKELQAIIASSEESIVAQEAEETDGDDIFTLFVSIVDDLLGSNLAEDVVAEFIESPDFQVYQQVGNDPQSADEELRAAFFAIVDGQLGNMDGSDIQVFVESEQFEIYQTVGNMYQ
ncbi:MAG: hypothetical protein O3B00_02530 [archaeon]|nr:hypothetical protein [archaeon]MDA1130359.1 hypothetical protein [archaeon]